MLPAGSCANGTVLSLTAHRQTCDDPNLARDASLQRRLLAGQAIARQIKHDFPGCQLTWAVSSRCRKVLFNNPDIDTLWEIPLESWSEMDRTWQLFEIEAHSLASSGHFDHVFLTQISPARFANYDGTVRPSLFRNYPRQISVPVDVTINLDAEEKAAVDAWFAASPAADASQVVPLRMLVELWPVIHGHWPGSGIGRGDHRRTS